MTGPLWGRAPPRSAAPAAAGWTRRSSHRVEAEKAALGEDEAGRERSPEGRRRLHWSWGHGATGRSDRGSDPGWVTLGMLAEKFGGVSNTLGGQYESQFYLGCRTSQLQRWPRPSGCWVGHRGFTPHTPIVLGSG